MLIHINPFPNKPWFLCVCSTSHLKTQWEKEKLLLTSNFSFFHSVFYAFGDISAIFIKFQNCHKETLSVWKSVKFVVWERVKVPSFGQHRICCLQMFSSWPLGGHNKPITYFPPGNLTKIITLSGLLLSAVFLQSGQSRTKIGLHILCSQILIYNGHKGKCSHERCFNPFPHNDTLGNKPFWKHCGKRRNCS